MLEIYKFEAMTTHCELQIYCNNKSVADSCAKDILYECKRLEKKYNYYSDHSYLHSINTRETNVLDNETKNLLRLSKHYYKETNGIFDVTIATLKNINIEKEKLLQATGCEHFKIKKDKIIFTNDYTKIDLGGFVKEYSVNRAIKIIKKYKITSALVNFGGDIYAHGRKPNNTKFIVGIKNPKFTNENIINIEIENKALTTSALYEREGHILSKNKLNSDILSATVISNCCIKSGVYSTSFIASKNLDIKLDHFLINDRLEIKTVNDSVYNSKSLNN
jgi:thiamine biosynthesis lipoprotein